MKKWLILLLLPLVTFVPFALSGDPAAKKTLVVKTSIYCDHCNECESCRPRIENELVMKKGIKSVKLNAKEQTLTVTYNDKQTDPSEIRRQISLLGYDADDVKADPEAYKLLDGCCKKKEDR